MLAASVMRNGLSGLSATLEACNAAGAAAVRQQGAHVTLPEDLLSPPSRGSIRSRCVFHIKWPVFNPKKGVNWMNLAEKSGHILCNWQRPLGAHGTEMQLYARSQSTSRARAVL